LSKPNIEGIHTLALKIEIPEPGGVFSEPWSTGKLVRMMSVFGPAAIVASVSIGAGETIVVVLAIFAGISGWSLAGKLFGAG
jgi:hypothetical protein